MEFVGYCVFSNAGASKYHLYSGIAYDPIAKSHAIIPFGPCMRFDSIRRLAVDGQMGSASWTRTANRDFDSLSVARHVDP